MNMSDEGAGDFSTSKDQTKWLKGISTATFFFF